MASFRRTYKVSNLNKSLFFFRLREVVPSAAVLGDLWIRGLTSQNSSGALLEKLEPADRVMNQLAAKPRYRIIEIRQISLK